MLQYFYLHKNLIKTVKSIAERTVGYTRFLFAIKNTDTHKKTTNNLMKMFASTRSPAGKTTTLEIKAANVEYAIQSNNLNIFEFSSILSENNTPNDLDK